MEQISTYKLTDKIPMLKTQHHNTSSTYTAPKEIQETRLAWLVWSLGCMFYFYEFLLQVSPGIMRTELTEAFHISAQGFGLLGGVYFYSYAGMQIPAGILLDKFGPRRLLTFATAICAIATLAFAHTTNFNAALVARFCIGFGSAFAVVGTMKLAANWFPYTRFALLTGIMVAIGMSGAIGGEKPLAVFIHNNGWQPSFNILGVAGLILAGLIFFITKDTPDASAKTQEKESTSIADVWSSLLNIIRNRQIWLVALYGGLIFMVTPVFCGLWGVSFLEAKFGFSNETAATLTSMVVVGWIVGSPTWGMFSDYIGKRKPPMIIGSILALLCFCTILYLPISGQNTVGILLFLFGLFSAGFLTAFSIIKEISCQKNCATALSFMNAMNMIGVAMANPFIGFMLDKLWSMDHTETMQTTIQHVSRTYDVSHYVSAISVLPIGMLIAICLLPFIKETNCMPAEEV